MRNIRLATLILSIAFACTQFAVASGASSFLEPKAWQCSIQAELKSERSEETGPGGMAYGPKRQLFQALGATGTKVESPSGNTDSYHITTAQSITGSIRLHHVYDSGDGIQIAGWSNGEAHVKAYSRFEGSEQNKTIFRDKTTFYDGPAKFEGDEYSPSFQLWLNPDQGTYSLDYYLAPVRGQQIEHCRMKKGMEGDRKKLEGATDADMPLGSFFGGLTKFTCPTERKSEVDIDGGAMSGMIENVPLPSGLVIEGEGESQFVDAKGVKMRWSCRPE